MILLFTGILYIIFMLYYYDDSLDSCKYIICGNV